MKILKIKGENLTTLESFEVDFNSEDFIKGGGLFVITGPTGAGKSTLLDCICIALYGITPRYNDKAGPSVGHPQMEATRLSVNDPRNLLRNGATGGFAEVDFIGAQELRYRARWEIRRARNKINGKIQDPTWRFDQIDEAGEVVAALTGKGVKELRARIVDAVGLTFEQFRRSVFLAQGDFDAFIKANSKERGELLERMTGTEIYRRLSIAAFTKAREARQTFEEVDRRARELHLLSPAQEQEYREQLQVREQEITALTEQIEAISREQSTLMYIENQERTLASATQNIEFHTQQITQKQPQWDRARRLLDLDPLRALLAERRAHSEALHAQRLEVRSLSARLEDRAAALARAESGCREIDEQVRALEARWGEDENTRTLVRAAEERAELLRHQLGEGERSLAAQRARVERAAEGLEQRRAVSASRVERLKERRARLKSPQSGGALVGHEEVWQQRGRDVAAALEAHHDKTRVADEMRAQVSRDQRALLDQEESARAASAAVGVAREALERLEAHRPGDLEGVQLGASRLSERRVALRGAREQLEQWASDLEQRGALERDLSAMSLEHDARRAAALSEANKALKLETHVELKGESLRQAMESSALARFRLELREGSPCPLCGSCEHPSAGAPLAQDLLTLTRDLEALKVAAAEARARANSAALDEAAAHARFTSAQATLTGAGLRVAQRAERAANATREALTSWPNLPALNGAVVSLQATLRASSRPSLTPLEGAPHLDLSGVRALYERLYARLSERASLPSDLEGAAQLGRDLSALIDALDEPLKSLDQLTRDTLSMAQARAEHQRALTAAEQRAGLCEELSRHARERLERSSAELSLAERRLSELRHELIAHRARLLPFLEVTPAHAAARALSEPIEVADLSSPRSLPAALQALTGGDVLNLVNAWAALASGWQGDERDARELEASLERDAVELPALESSLAEERDALRAEEERHGLRVTAHAGSLAELDRLGEQRARLERLQSELAGARADLEALRLERDQLGVAHAEAHDLAHAADLRLAGLEAVSLNAQARWEEHARAAQTSEAELDDISSVALSAARVALSEEALLRQELDTHRTRAAQLKEEIAHLLGELKSALSLSELKGSLRDKRAALQERQSMAMSERASLSAQLAHNQTNKSQHAQVEAERRRLAHELSRWEGLNQLIGSANGSTFRDFAQSLTLELILEHANYFLKDLAPRYSLMRIPDENLALQVVDHDFGDEIRSVQSLSGGETFLVSLSLALGLSSTSAQDVQIQSLFIDEGFGTLDPASLDVAISVLENLQVEGRLIGMISHVEGLSERVGLEVRVEPQGSGRSTVRVRSHA